MIIFQPDRILLRKQIKKYSHFIKGKVLDIGAGGFNRYIDLFNHDEYIMMDPTSSGVQVKGSILDIPFPSETFDSVVCTQVLEHISEPFKGVEEIYRVLKKGGKCLVTVPQDTELHEEPHDYYRYTKYGLGYIFKKCGFKIIRTSQRGGFFTLLAQIVIRYLINRFNLYQRPVCGRLAKYIFKTVGETAIWFDKLDRSPANKRHTIGWACVFQK